MTIIEIHPLELALAALLVLLLAGLGRLQGLGISRQLLIAALRTAIQLTLIGYVLKTLFAHVHLAWIAAMSMVMLLVAGWEVLMRQKRPFRGWWGYGLGVLSMFTSSFVLTIFALTVIIAPDPWYTPQYAIPLLGMMLGNTMSGIALAMDRLTNEAWRDKEIIETRLALGHSWREAIASLQREAMRTGMIPMINAMAAAGVVSLPGMMTGQILAGNPPMVAVNYQILIMFLLTAGSGFGTSMAVWIGSRRLFDHRQRLRLDRLGNGRVFGRGEKR